MSEQDKSGYDLDPMAVMRVASAYWDSSILHVANSLDVFTKLPRVVLPLQRKWQSAVEWMPGVSR